MDKFSIYLVSLGVNRYAIKARSVDEAKDYTVAHKGYNSDKWTAYARVKARKMCRVVEIPCDGDYGFIKDLS